MKKLTRKDLQPYMQKDIRVPFRLVPPASETLEGTVTSIAIKEEREDAIISLELTAENVQTIGEDKHPVGQLKQEVTLTYAHNPLLIAKKTEASLTIRAHRELLILFFPEVGIPTKNGQNLHTAA